MTRWLPLYVYILASAMFVSCSREPEQAAAPSPSPSHIDEEKHTYEQEHEPVTVHEVDAHGRILFEAIADETAVASDANQTVPGQMYVEPSTLHSLGFQWNIAGDANRNSRVIVQYRMVGDNEWRQGHDMLRIQGERIAFGVRGWDEKTTYVCGNLHAGSILFLEPGTQYDVMLTMIDPDFAGPDHVVSHQLLRVRTKSLPAMFAGRELHVYPSDHEDEKLSPHFENITAAYKQAEPGDHVVIHAGTYEQGIIANRAGTREKPIVIRAAGDGEVVLSAGGNPCINLTGDHHWISGLLFKTEGVGIRANGTVKGITVTRCRFEGIQHVGVVMTSPANRDIYIADNEFIGTQGTWHDRKKQLPYKAVWVAGQGVDVCYNYVVNHWDGISVRANSPTEDFENKLCSIDFYNNDIAQIVDDNEADGGQHNIRFFHNRFFDVYVGLSAQPVYGGPAYFVRNLQYNVSTGKVFKLNVWPAGVLIYNNTTVSGCPDIEPGVAFLNRGWWNTHIYNNVFLGITGDALTAGPRDPSISRLDHNGYHVTGIIRWYDFDEAAQRKPLAEGEVITSLPGESGFRKFATFAEFTAATGQERHAVALDYSDFVQIIPPDPAATQHDAQTIDPRPAAKSRAIDAGMVIANITDGYSGAAPDLGMLELGEPLPHFGPRPIGAAPGDR